MQKQLLFTLVVLAGYLHPGFARSCTDTASYRDICHKASVNPWVFQNFRSMPQYFKILGLPGGEEFATYILKQGAKKSQESIAKFQKLETIGKPMVSDFQGIGKFSGTTLRYIVIADHIQKLFKLPDSPKIVEIGAGFGGQCYILSCLQDFSKYYIYDLPEVERLIEKVATTLGVNNVTCLEPDRELPEKEVDLLVSNYAFSECDRDTQIAYFDRVIKKAKRGYVIYNRINQSCGFSALSPEDFVTMLKNSEKNATIQEELINTCSSNVLITWGIDS